MVASSFCFFCVWKGLFLKKTNEASPFFNLSIDFCL